MISKTQVAKLLGRSLTSIEDANFDTYINIATKELATLLCMTICSQDETRIFQSRDGYSTLYIDPFTDIESVLVNGTAVTTYTKKQFDSYQGSWFNILEFDDRLGDDKVTVVANWGFQSLPSDLQLLLAQLFKTIGSQTDTRVKSKSIEDFSVTYNGTTEYEQTLLNNASIIHKYAQCEGAISHGGW